MRYRPQSRNCPAPEFPIPVGGTGLCLPLLVALAVAALVWPRSSIDAGHERTDNVAPPAASLLRLVNLADRGSVVRSLDLRRLGSDARTVIPLDQAVAPVASLELALAELPLLASGSYAAAVTADGPLAAQVASVWPDSGSAVAYTAPEPGTDVVVPVVFGYVRGMTSRIVVQNVDDSSPAEAVVTVNYPSGGPPAQDVGLTIAPGTAETFRPSEAAESMSVRVTSTSRVAVLSLLDARGPAANGAAAFEGIPTDEAVGALYAPLVRNAWTDGGRSEVAGTSMLAVTNLLAISQDIQVTFRGRSGTCDGRTYVQEASVPDGGMVELWGGSPSSHVQGDNLPDDCLASAVVTASGGRLLGTVVDRAGTSWEPSRWLAAYDLLRSGSSRVVVPAVHKADHGRSTSIAVMNVGSFATIAKIELYDQSGEAVDGCGEACVLHLGPLETVDWSPTHVPSLAAGTSWRAVLTSEGSLAVVAQEAPSGGPGDFTTVPGIAADDATALTSAHLPLMPNEVFAQPTASPASSVTPVPSATPRCSAVTALLSVSCASEQLDVGQAVTVTARLANNGCGVLGDPYYELRLAPEAQGPLEPITPAYVDHHVAVLRPGEQDEASFGLRGAWPGSASLAVVVTFEAVPELWERDRTTITNDSLILTVLPGQSRIVLPALLRRVQWPALRPQAAPTRAPTARPTLRPSPTPIVPPAPLVSQIGGNSAAVAIAHQTAYVGIGPRVVVYDLGDRRTPLRVGQSEPLSGLVRAIALDGVTVYVAAGSGGLWVLDVSDPRQPTLLANSPTHGHSMDVAVGSGIAYVTELDAGLRVLDISARAAPSVLANVAGEGVMRDVELAGDRLVVTTGAMWDTPDAGVAVFGVTDPSAPRLLGRIALWLGAAGLATDGTSAFVASGGGDLVVVDVSTSDSPKVLASLDADLDTPYWDEPGSGLALEGRYLYSLSWLGLTVFDVGSGSTPTRVGAVNLPEGIAVGVGDGLACVTGGALQVVDVSDAAGPELVGSGDKIPGAVAILPIRDHLAYLDTGESRPAMLDLSVPDDPVVSWTEPGSWPWYRVLTTRGAVAVSSRTGWRRSELAILDTTDAFRPREIAALPLDSTTDRVAPYLARLDDDRLLVLKTYGLGGSRLALLDLADPARPVRSGELNLGFIVSDVAVVGDLAYLAMTTSVGDTEGSYPGALVVAELTGPGRPRVLGTLLFDRSALAVEARGSLAFILTGMAGYFSHAAPESGLHVVDVADPGDPREIAFEACQGVSRGLALVDDRAYVSVMETVALPHEWHDYSIGGRIAVFDITDPGNPRFSGVLPVGSYSSSPEMWLDQGVLWTPTAYTGLWGWQVRPEDG